MEAAAQVETAQSATGYIIYWTRTLFGGTRQQGLRAGTSRFLSRHAFVGWKVMMSIYCIVWAAWWDRGEDLDIRVYLATWVHLIATFYFIISTISAFLCIAYLSREKPRKDKEGNRTGPKPPKATRSPVPCYFRYLQHISWVLSCIGSMVVMSVFWLAIYQRTVPVSSLYISATILAVIMVVDQFLIASEFQIKFAWTCLYFFVVYIFYNVIYYYENNDEDRLSFEVFDWDPEPGKACLWVFLILAFFIPGFAAFHFFIYRLRERMHASYSHLLAGGEEEQSAKPDKEEKKEEVVTTTTVTTTETSTKDSKDEGKSKKKKKEKDQEKKKEEEPAGGGNAPAQQAQQIPQGGYFIPAGYAPGVIPPGMGPPPTTQSKTQRAIDLAKEVVGI